MMKQILIVITGIVLLSILINCSDFLEEKSDTRLVTPETLNDNQALLDKISNLLGNTSISGEISSDDIYITDNDFNSISYDSDKRLYTWQSAFVSRPDGNDWLSCYSRINICNTVLNNIKMYNINNSENITGQALTIRASIYLEAAQIWCVAYNKNSADKELGLPLRLDPDINNTSVRVSLKETYNQIVSDLLKAVNLLPDQQVSVTRASKMTALSYLARTYLYMGDYSNALKYANQALTLKNDLLDYNQLNPNDSYPIKGMNVETILPSDIAYSEVLGSYTAKIPETVYDLYGDNDLRKIIFFRNSTNGEITFKGNYSGNSTRMSLIATDELYLIAAESHAQLDDISNAMSKLNQLLIKRWKAGTFVDVTASGKSEALNIIYKERRKELLFRGLRWADLKRYNRDGANITLQRTVNGVNYKLMPNDLRYAIAIPEDIIKMTNMPQNPR